MAGAFEGLNVLDFCWVAVGPMTTRYFSDFGATVVRVESRHRPDVIRSGLPFAGGRPGVNRSGYWVNYNGGKLSLTLNMAHPAAREVAFELATSWADVVAENFTPGAMGRWGLGYEDISQVNPGVVMFSASMMGRGGPYEAQPGFGPVLTALSGHTHYTGWPDRAPVSPYGAYTDFVIPHVAVAAITAALETRRETGMGQHLDMSQLEASLQFLAPAILDYTANGRVGTRDGNRDPAMAPHGVYPCRGEDRWCAIACANDEQWASLAGIMGHPELRGRLVSRGLRPGRPTRVPWMRPWGRGHRGWRLKRSWPGVRRGASPQVSFRAALTSSPTLSSGIGGISQRLLTLRLGPTLWTGTASRFRKPGRTIVGRRCWGSTRNTRCGNCWGCRRSASTGWWRMGR